MGVFIREKMLSMWKKNERDDAERKAKQSPTPGVDRLRDLAYIDDGHKMHQLDIFYPENTQGLLPTIFDVHGGGWMYGDKELNEYFCMSLSAMGFTVVDISYRLIPEVQLKEQVSDVFAALQWIGENGKNYHCDLEKFFITGDSAGGHLSSLVTAINTNDEALHLYGFERLPFEIKGICINHGIGDLHNTMIGSKAVQNESERFWFGKRPKNNPIYYKSSLVEIADASTYPPALILTSKPDELFRNSVQIMDFFDAGGFKYERYIPDENAPGAQRLGHVFNVLYPEWEESRAANHAMTDFFKRQLIGE
ncbi:MAG: alpha/beta hydrolase [Lachnospiraceae bacterium]|jgi:acetyl esterase/lipase|nr:alpha/beta hydrolase [Lachnospiraceae bacterium]